MSYTPGDMYRCGWSDRMAGNPINYNQNGILLEEYIKGYNDCHTHIIETEKNLKTSSYLNGHPLYKEAHEQSSRTFLSD
jgi:hypothetical protein